MHVISSFVGGQVVWFGIRYFLEVKSSKLLRGTTSNKDVSLDARLKPRAFLARCGKGDLKRGGQLHARQL